MKDPIGAGLRIGQRYVPRLAYEGMWLRQRRTDPLFRVVEALVNPGDVAIDIGASRGLYTSRLMRLVGRSGEVHAVEANPALVAHLRRFTTRRRSLVVHGVALSDRAGVAQLRLPQFDGYEAFGMASIEPTNAKAGAEYRSIEVPTSRLDELIPRNRHQKVNFIKCDVEGHEFAVLGGAMGILKEDRPTVVIEIEQRHQQRNISEVFAIFAEAGYRGLGFRGDHTIPVRDFDVNRDQMGWIADNSGVESVPDAYVHNFLFTPSPEVESFVVDTVRRCAT